MKPKNPSLRSSVFTTLCVAISLSTAAFAAPITWTGTTDTVYSTGTNWVGDAAPADDLDAVTGDIATFGDPVTSNEPDLSGGDRSVNGLDFASTGWTLSGGSTLSLGTGGITSTGSNAVTAPLIAGAAGTYSTGNLTTLTLDQISGGPVTFGTALADGTVVLGGGSDNDSFSPTAAFGTLVVNKGTPGGTSDAGSSVNNVTVDAGANLEFGPNRTIRGSGGGRGQIYGTATVNGTMDLKGDGTVSENWAMGGLSGSGVVTNTGTGDVTLEVKGGNFSGQLNDGDHVTSLLVTSGNLRTDNSSGDYSGGTTVTEGGNLWVKNDAALGAAGTSLTLDNANLQNNNSHTTIDAARAITVGAEGASLTAGWSRTLTINAAVGGAGKVTILEDSGTVRLLGANTYIGGTDIIGDGLTRGNLEVGTTLGTGDILFDGGKLQNRDSLPVLANDVTIGAGGARLKAGWGKNVTLNGIVSGVGVITVEGDSGTVVLGNAANTFTGDINLVAANSRLRVASLGTTGTYSGAVSGDGIFDYAFPTTPTLDGTFTHTGGTAISDVTVSATDFPSLNCFNGSQDIIIEASGTLDVEGTAITNGLLNPEGTLLNSGAAVDLSGNMFTSNGGSFTVDGTGDVTLGDITQTDGNPTVIKEGANTLTLTGATDNVGVYAVVNDGTLVLAKDPSAAAVHAIGGELTINGGIVELGGTGNDQIYLRSTVTLNTGGTLDINTRNERFKFLNLYGGDVTGSTGELRVNSAGGAGFIDAQSGTVSAILIGDAPLEKTTAGTVTLSGANTNSGDITVTEGTLTLTQVNPNNESATVSIAASGATLDLTSGATDTVDKLYIGTTQLDAGEYGAIGSVAPVIGIAQITGTGTLTVTTTPTGYDVWANSYLPTDVSDPAGDNDNDGIANLVEYAIDGQDPTVSNTNIGTFAGDLLSFTKRATATGLTYAILESTDLGIIDDWTEVSGVGYTNDASTISYQLTPVSPVKNFTRLQVIEN